MFRVATRSAATRSLGNYSIGSRLLSGSSDSASLVREFNPKIATSLRQYGYAIVDNAVSQETSTILRGELEALSELPGALTPNKTHFVTGRADSTSAPLLLTKPHVLEAEMHTASDSSRAAAPTLAGLSEDSALAAMLSCYEPSLTLTETAVKAQVNAGHGGCFPIHVDSDASVDRRVVTALLYPNAEWDVSNDGGALRVYPFPRGARDPRAHHVDIAPAPRRLVLLSATELHHRVLPSRARRYCVTLWLSGRASGRARAEPAADCGDARRVLRAPRYRKHAARIALSPAWEQSLRDAHGDALGPAAVEAHRRDVRSLARALEAEISARYPNVDTRQLREALGDPGRLDDLLAWREGEEHDVGWFG